MPIARILALALVLASPAAAQTVSGAPHVVDGDSLRVGGVTVRLHAIDAPELRQTCTRDGKEWPCGREAAATLRALINGRPVWCALRDLDRLYNRWVMACRVSGTDINAVMVESGMALAYRRFSLQYVPQEDAARAARRGMWSGTFVRPEEYRRRKGGEE